MKRRRVKITGIGLVTPAGIGRDEFTRQICESISRIAQVRRFPDEAGPFVAAEVRNFKCDKEISGLNTKRMPRHTQFAARSALLALADAGLGVDAVRKKTPLIVVGAALMDFGTINKGVDLILRHGPLSALPTSVSDALVSGITAAIGELIGGPTHALSLQSACCSGLDAIGIGAEKVSAGEVDIAICGGTEAPLHFHPMLELKLAGLAPNNGEFPGRQGRPFDRWRTTGVIGEGACIVVLEPEGSPRPGYAFVRGHGFASDTGGEPCAGMEAAMHIAAGNAGIRPSQIDAVSAWGPGHKILDAAESGALFSFLGPRIAEVPAYSIKGAIGNPLAAAGAVQVGCAALGIKQGFLPPTVNWEYPDPACPLNLSNKVRYVSHETVLVNAHGLSGANACLILSR